MYTSPGAVLRRRRVVVHRLITTRRLGPGGNVVGMDEERRFGPGRIAMSLTRVWLPLGIGLAGVVLIAIGHGSYSDLADTHSIESAGGVALLLVALCVWMLNWMYRLSVQSTKEREYEEDARRYFDRTGRWPDEE
jgi:hypothetical protein